MANVSNEEIEITTMMMAAFLRLPELKKERILGIAIGFGLSNEEEPKPKDKRRKGAKFARN